MPMSPPTVGLSFGSFGDIVTVLQLAWELRAALDQSAGASTEIQAVVRDVDVFTRAMQDVQANVERRRTHLRSDVLNGLSAALSRCRETLRVIQQRIERARSQTTISGWQRYWGTATWSILGGKKELEALRTHLSDQVGTMQLYLSLSDANSQEHVQEEIAAHGTTLERMFTIVQDIQLRFDVGVPSFRFYDDDDNRYYLPLARTSLQRLLQVHEKLWHRERKLHAWEKGDGRELEGLCIVVSDVALWNATCGKCLAVIEFYIRDSYNLFCTTWITAVTVSVDGVPIV